MADDLLDGFDHTQYQDEVDRSAGAPTRTRPATPGGAA